MKRTHLLMAGAPLATAVIYLAVLDNFMVADSWVFMTPQSFFDTFAYFTRTMLPPEFNALWLRPIPMFTYWLDTVLWPGSSMGPHLINLAIHILNTVLVMRIVGIACGNDEKAITGIPAFLAGVLYGIHPLGVGAVAWVAARFDLMSVTFGLLGMGMWLSHPAERGMKSTAAAVLFFALAVLSKEQGIIYAAACGCVSLYSVFASSKKRSATIRDAAILLAFAAVYLVYRIAVFQGLGGYMEARHGLSAFPPLYYFLALLYPFGNAPSGAGIPVAAIAGIALIATTAYFLMQAQPDETGKRNVSAGTWIAASLLVLVFGLATNAPNPGMTLERVMGHAESRFALNAITALAVFAGLISARLTQSDIGKRMILILLLFWTIPSAWRTGVQIDAWDRAGEQARGIVQDTIRQQPSPPAGGRLLFFDIPLTNDQWAYIFGIGLEEALHSAYGRDDIRIIRYPKREDLRNANPQRDAVFSYNAKTEQLERLHAEKRTSQ